MAKSQQNTALVHDPTRTMQWNSNHTLIRDAYIEILRTEKRRPRIDELAKKTSLGEDTIVSHMKNFKFDPQDGEFRMLTPDVLLGMFRQIVKNGRAAETKLWMQIVEGMKFTDDESQSKVVVEKAVIQIIDPQNNTTTLP